MDETATAHLRAHILLFGIAYIMHLTKFANRSPLHLLLSGNNRKQRNVLQLRYNKNSQRRKKVTTAIEAVCLLDLPVL